MKSKVLKVALTGGIASGKSLVSDLLEIHGCKIIDLDVISREVVMPGAEGLQELVDSFGESILMSDGSLDRKNLRDVLYKKGRNRALIEQILHPKILQKMKVNILKVLVFIGTFGLAMAFAGNAASCFFRVKRSSWAAATIAPSTNKEAALSW